MSSGFETSDNGEYDMKKVNFMDLVAKKINEIHDDVEDIKRRTTDNELQEIETMCLKNTSSHPESLESDQKLAKKPPGIKMISSQQTPHLVKLLSNMSKLNQSQMKDQDGGE